MDSDSQLQPQSAIQKLIRIVKKLFAGEYGLYKSFWYFLFPVLLMVSLGKEQLMKTDMRFLTVFMTLIYIYLFIALIGSLRAAFKYKDDRTGGLIKVIAILSLAYFSFKWILSAMMLGLLIYSSLLG